MFADDCELAAHCEFELQRFATCFSPAAKAFGLAVSIQKSVVMHQPAPATCGTEPSISIDDATLKNVENFTYLDSCLSSYASLDMEIAIRLFKASNSFGRLRSRVWNERGLKEETKIAFYRAVVLFSLLLWMRILDVLSQTPQEVRSVSSLLLPQDPGHCMDGQSIEPRCPPACKSPWFRSLDHQGAATVVWSRNAYGRQSLT